LRYCELWDSLDHEERNALKEIVTHPDKPVASTLKDRLSAVGVLVVEKGKLRVFCEALEDFVHAQPPTGLSYVKQLLWALTSGLWHRFKEWWVFELWFRGVLVLILLVLAILLLASGLIPWALITAMLTLFFALALARLAWRFGGPL